mmetsp:Transcript_9373/g.19400  ORF Transcript_9373/g.19400 Transcript_9373/m.19400 type:complete len:200 (+) Transcript_9373:101-700(+)
MMIPKAPKLLIFGFALVALSRLTMAEAVIPYRGIRKGRKTAERELWSLWGNDGWKGDGHTPTKAPTPNPTYKPTEVPTNKPSSSPTRLPTKQPTKEPTINQLPYDPTAKPTSAPTSEPTATAEIPSPTASPNYFSNSPTTYYPAGHFRKEMTTDCMEHFFGMPMSCLLTCVDTILVFEGDDLRDTSTRESSKTCPNFGS